MTANSEVGAEQRVHPRHEYQIAVGIMGLLPTSGVTVDISRGGVKVGLPERVPENILGETVAVRFLNVGDEVKPHYMVGTVRRVEATEQGCFVGIKFVAPLEVVDLRADDQDVG